MSSLRSIRLAPKYRLPVAAFFACVGLLGLLGGCLQASRSGPGIHTVRINSTASEPVTKGAGYRIATSPRNVDETSLVYDEAARLVKYALATHGLYEAPPLDRKAMVVEIDYGMSSTRSARSSAQAAPPPRPEPGTAVNEDVTQLRTATRGPLEKRLVLTAREGSGAGDAAPRILWRIELAITDLSNDLRKYLPLLVAAGIDRLGVDSGGTQTVPIGENDKAVVVLVRQAK
ncbi:MAG: hypothetical protein ABIZ49_05085 [Opitutaceae bacterium]